MTFDLVIRGGDVVDGSGLARYRADVGIRSGVIAEIGRIRERGEQEIDAEGHVVSPGFIDGHTHMDAQVMWDGLGTSSCFHGVTTVVMGNCGFTLAPARSDQRHLVVRNLERAEDISAEAMAEGICWDWQTFAEYLDAVDRRPKGINYAAYIGHSALRTSVMGERAFVGQATEDDLAAMERELVDALSAGAIGFSTSRSANHETSDERPVASRLASWGEVRQLVATMGRKSGGIFEIATEADMRSPDPDVRALAMARLQALAVETGVPVTFGVTTVDPARSELLELIEVTSRTGGRMFGQGHSRGVSLVLSFKTRLIFDTLPTWRNIRALPEKEQLGLLRDSTLRARLVEEADTAHYGPAVGAQARAPDYDAIYVLKDTVGTNETVAQVAKERRCTGVEVMLDLAVESRFEQLFIQKIGTADSDELLAIMRHPRVVMTFSDAGAHVSQIMDASIQTYLLSHWVRESQAFTLEEAVRMITLAPARAWGFADRGLIREGLVADVNIFDPARVRPRLPTVEADLPGGGKRLVQHAEGFLATVVGGEVLLRQGVHTGAMPGRVLRARARLR